MAGENIKEFTDDNFESEVLSSDIPVVVDVWASWCGPCVKLTPIIEELAVEYGDTIKVGKLNIDNNPQTASKYGVMSIPTIFFVKNGEIADTQVGLLPKDMLKSKIDALIES